MRNKITLLFTVFLFFSITSIAQSDVIPGYEKFSNKFGKEDLTTMEKVKANIADAINRISNIKPEEKALSKYFQKKNTKKAEKKSVPLKKKWIGAYTIYNTALNSVYDMYNSWLNEAKYYDEDTRKKVADLSSQAEVNRGKANDLFGKYRKSSDGDLKKNILYQKMKVDLNQSGKLSMDALKYMVQALEIVFEQEELMNKDDIAWKKALSEGIFESYVAYIKDFPRGKHVDEAKEKIKQHKAEIANERATKAKADVDLYYRIQIVAVSKKLTERRLKRVYANVKEVEEYLDPVDGFYKYYIGKFSRYQDAKNFEEGLGNTDAFVVAYMNGQRANIKEAIAAEQEK